MSSNPEHQKVQFEQACGLIGSGQAHSAATILEKIVSEGSAWDEVYSKLGVSYIIQGRRADAIDAFMKAVEANEQFVPAYSNLCIACAEEEEFEQAVSYGEQGLAIDPDYIPLYSSLAYALKPLGRLDEAIDYIRKALSHEKENIQLLNNLGSLLYENGEKEEAQEIFEIIIATQPNHGTAHRVLSQLKKYKESDAHLAQMLELDESKNFPIAEKPHLHFAIAKAYEDIKDFERSAHYYKLANSAHRQTLAYNMLHDEDYFKQIKSVFTADFIKTHQLKPSNQVPIFILGMPRSATSLVEQILASHPKVHGSGELNYIEHIQFKKAGLSKENYVDGLISLPQSNWEVMKSCYLQKLSAIANGHEFTTDKMPHNFRYIGLIKCLFPQARIIHCIRDRRDTCLSIFKQFFVGDMPFAYDETEIANYYQLYEDLMAHWYDVLPDEIYKLHYEQLITNPELSIRNMLEFCDLEWSDQCMEFHKTKRAVTTASALQVKQPIYKDALHYWKNYETYFDF